MFKKSVYLHITLLYIGKATFIVKTKECVTYNVYIVLLNQLKFYYGRVSAGGGEANKSQKNKAFASHKIGCFLLVCLRGIWSNYCTEGK